MSKDDICNAYGSYRSATDKTMQSFFCPTAINMDYGPYPEGPSDWVNPPTKEGYAPGGPYPRPSSFALKQAYYNHMGPIYYDSMPPTKEGYARSGMDRGIYGANSRRNGRPVRENYGQKGKQEIRENCCGSSNPELTPNAYGDPLEENYPPTCRKKNNIINQYYPGVL